MADDAHSADKSPRTRAAERIEELTGLRTALAAGQLIGAKELAAAHGVGVVAALEADYARSASSSTP